MLQGAARNLLPYLTARRERRVRPVGRARAGATDCPTPADGARASSACPSGPRRPARDADPWPPAARRRRGRRVATGPGLLLGDEPTSQLDHEARDVVLDALAQINRRDGHHGRRRHPRPRRGRPDAAHRHHPRRPGRGRGPRRRRSSPWSPPTARSRCRRTPSPPSRPGPWCACTRRTGVWTIHREEAGRVSADEARSRGRGCDGGLGPVVAVQGASLAAGPGELVARHRALGCRASPSCCGPWPARCRWPRGACGSAARRCAAASAGAARDAALIPQGNGLATIALRPRERADAPRSRPGSRRPTRASGPGRAGRVGPGGVGEPPGRGALRRPAAACRGRPRVRARGPACCSPTSRPPSSTTTTASACWPCCGREAARGAAVVMATHDPEAAAQADSEVRLDDGQLSQVRAAQH